MYTYNKMDLQILFVGEKFQQIGLCDYTKTLSRQHQNPLMTCMLSLYLVINVLKYGIEFFYVRPI